MREIIYYEANDGKRFESETDCLNYEFEQDFEPIADELALWDDNGDIIKITPYTNIDDAWAIHCSSIDAAIFLKEWGEKDRVTTPYTNIDIMGGCAEVPLGEFIWLNSSWNHIDEVISSLEIAKRHMANREKEIFIITNY